jgi:hypothetical protein
VGALRRITVLARSRTLGRVAVVMHAELPHMPEGEVAATSGPKVRLLSLPVLPTGDLGYRGVRGVVGLGYRFTV